jgi:ribose transport system ATP-binding protein
MVLVSDRGPRMRTDLPDAIPSHPASLLAMGGVCKRYGGVEALRDVDLSIAPGEVHALVGENGAGKSTLMKVLSGVERPDAGTMEFAGREWKPAGPVQARRAGVAMIHQELALAPHLSIAENIALGVEPRKFRGLGPLAPLDRRLMHSTASRVLARLGHGGLDPTRRTGDLPAATRQLVEIGRAIASRATVMIMDEPTSSLGRHDADRLLEVVKRLRDEGLSIVYISHFLEEIRRVADRFTVLRDGKTVATAAIASSTDQSLIELMTGRSVGAVFPKRKRRIGDVALRVDGLKGRPMPIRASLEVRSGEIVGLAGLVGAGRTEFLRCIAGLAPIAAGAITIDGHRLASNASIRARLRRGLGFLSEDRKGEGLALRMSIAENLLLSNFQTVATQGVLSAARMKAAANQWIERLAIRSADPGRAAGTLSGGNQQKIAIARLLHQDSTVLLLDEPTRGIDIGSKVQVYELLDGLARAGRAVVVSSGHLPELLGLCDRIAVMHRGVLGPARDVAECTEASLMSEAVLGSDGEVAA